MKHDTSANQEDPSALIAVLRAQVTVLTEQVTTLTAQVVALEAENAQLRGKGGGTPAWVKANRPTREKKPRTHRRQACVRRRETPDDIQEHVLECCPDCGRQLSGGWLHASRQVIEITLPQVRVVEHRFLRRRCGVCGKNWLPKASELRLGTVGRRRFGVSIQSLVSLLQIAYRLPIDMIRRLLKEFWGLQISAGEIVALTAGVAKAGAKEVAQIQHQVRGSPVVCCDETGWREDGLNGYLWTFATPLLRYFHCQRSRARKVAEEVLGKDFTGLIVSDFYSAYNQVSEKHQRCWAHLLRDLHALKETHADEAAVVAWAEQVTAVYARAMAFRDDRPKARRQAQAQFERELARLARPYRSCKEAPQRLLAKRIQQYRGQLFCCVADPQVPATNNLAERSLRPAVIARKISGGTRSEQGSATRAALMSLFGSWAAQEKNLLASCKDLLLAPTCA